MGRFLKVAVYIAVLFLAYLWIATVAKSCNKRAVAESNDNTEMVDDVADVYSDEFEDDLFEDEEGSDYDETATSDGMGGGTFEDNDLVDNETIDYTEVDDIIENNSPTPKVTQPKQTTTTTSTNASYSGKFMLLAGSYLIEDNARVMVKKLKKLGYKNAEMVIFDMSQYHSVCAGRYSSLSSAQQESSTLKRKGIDNYVHTKQ
ncbi:MAG: SPOR domain-containing protein [Saprospiraceae bacterium]|nr:SPOR domain-containing protein [Saprospiraceae bacterium]